MSPRSYSLRTALLAGVLVAATLLAWSNSLSGPFVFDDRPAILANPTLDRFATALFPPRDGGTVAGRPLVNLTLALNRAISGTDVWSYHAFNLVVHVANGLLLFMLVRRTLTAAGPPARVSPTTIAFSAALLWLLHPLQTAAVTYVVQRAESLCAFFYLVTLYGFHRSALSRPADDNGPRERAVAWRAVSVVACALGMATKEVMVAAPFVVWLYDRTFVSGGFLAALRARRGYYAALAGTWLLLVVLVFSNAGRAGTAGFGTEISPLHYAFTQCRAIAQYLWLSLWPRNLIFDYGTAVERSFTAIWPQALLLALLVATTLVALRRRPRLGFLFAAALLVLAPSSSVLPIATQTIAEHRMYLPLAALTTGLALGFARIFGRFAPIAAMSIAAALGTATFERNRDYRSALALWADTVAQRPENPRAHNNLGIELARTKQLEAALRHYEHARLLAPNDPEVLNNLGNVLVELGRSESALPYFERSVALKPGSGAARLTLALALSGARRAREALPHFEAAAALMPLDAAALTSFGAALAETGDPAGAIARYRRALELEPASPRAHYNLGLALARIQDWPQAAAAFAAAVELEPQHVAARVNLGNALLLLGRPADAIAAYEAALELNPDNAQLNANLALARRQLRGQTR